MAVVLTLQVLHDYSDRETAEAARFDVRWKVATGAPLDDPGFDPSSLVYWRNRIAKSARPDRISDAVKKVIEETGVLKGRRRRAVDSTILADGVATQDTVTQLVAAIRQGGAGGARRGGADRGGVHRARLQEAGQAEDRLGRSGGEGRAGIGLVNDANALVAALQDRDLDERAAPRWRCWPWSPGRTWSRPRAPMGPTGGGGSPVRSPRTG